MKIVIIIKNYSDQRLICSNFVSILLLLLFNVFLVPIETHRNIYFSNLLIFFVFLLYLTLQKKKINKQKTKITETFYAASIHTGTCLQLFTNGDI